MQQSDYSPDMSARCSVEPRALNTGNDLSVSMTNQTVKDDHEATIKQEA